MSVVDLSIISSSGERWFEGETELFLTWLSAGEVFILKCLRAGEVEFVIFSCWMMGEPLAGLSLGFWEMDFEISLFPLKVCSGVPNMELKYGVESRILPFFWKSSKFREVKIGSGLFTGDLNLEVFKGESTSGFY